jgi:hypothetical protein
MFSTKGLVLKLKIRLKIKDNRKFSVAGKRNRAEEFKYGRAHAEETKGMLLGPPTNCPT